MSKLAHSSNLFDDAQILKARNAYGVYLMNKDNPLMSFEEFCAEFDVELPGPEADAEDYGYDPSKPKEYA